MRVILIKLIKDFKFSKVKGLLLILASSLSGWGISSVVYSYFMTERDFKENFEVTFPADLTMVIDHFSQEIEKQFLKDDEVIDIERREAIRARVKANNDSWIPIIIYAVENVNNIRYDQFRILNNAILDNKILIEKNATFYLNPGQNEVDLIFQGSEEVVSWEIGGETHDARQAPARMEGMVYAYTSAIKKIEPYIKKGRKRILIKTNVSRDERKLERLKDRLINISNKYGGSVVSAYIPKPGQHIHQGLVDNISFLQKSGGAILSIMGIILMSLILLTWVFPQIVDIGVMKAIGASTRNIFLSYVIVLLGIIITGMLIGLPLGYITASMYSSGVAFFQNFEEVTTLLPLPVHVLVSLICIIVPLSFGVYPLHKSAQTSVNEALNKTFYMPQRSLFFKSQRMISNIRLKYSLNNLLRHSQRTVLIILLLAVGMSLYFTATNVEYSIRSDLKKFALKSQYELVVSLPGIKSKQEVSFLDEIYSLKKVSGINSEHMTYFPPSLGNPERALVNTLSLDFKIDKKLVRRGHIDKSCTDCIYVGTEELSNQFADVEIGETIEITTDSGEVQEFIFSGVMEDMMLTGAPFIRFDKKTSSHFNRLAFELYPDLSPEEVQSVSNRIDDLFIENGINIRSLQSINRRMSGILGHLAPTFLIIKITGIFTIVLGLLGLIIVLNLTIQERSREIGIMKSIGSPFDKISGLFKQEFMLINIIAIIAGMLISIPVSTVLIGIIAETIIRHPVPFTNNYVINTIAIVIVLSVQTILISTYNRYKIDKNARELLDHHF